MLDTHHPEESVRSSAGQIDGVEALRALAVTWVVMFHYFVVRDAAAGDPWNAWVAATGPASVVVRNGPLGVDLFFIITGFLLVMPWARSALEGLPPPSARHFLVRRVRRIVPAYYVQLLLLLGVFLPLLQGVQHAWAERGFIAYNAVAHATFLHYTTPLSSASLSLNGALWSLTLEAQFYLLLPLLAPLFVRAPVAWAVALGALACLWRWLALNDLGGLVAIEMALGNRWAVPEEAIRHLLHTQLPGYLGHFAAGMAMGLAWWRHRGHVPSRLEESLRWLAAAAGLAALYWLHGLGGGALLGSVGWWLVSLAGLAALVFACVGGGPITRAVVVHRPLLFVGRASYSIYLYHLPLLLAWNHFRILDGSAWSLPCYLALVVAAGWTSYRLVERPFLRRADILARL
ncbi:MAG: acyltransferase [Usitatibacter sp.]